VNGDGYADVVVGAPYFDNGQNDEGRAYLFYGNGGPGVPLRPRQWRVNSNKPIAHLGKSDATSSFRLLVGARTPYGRGLVKLEWEVKPLGATFNGLGTGRSASWQDTGVTGLDLGQVITGLNAGRNYHWRVRLLYHSGRLPFAQHSRWFTMPWNGWNEKDFRKP
jgi:hypothetical protein